MDDPRDVWEARYARLRREDRTVSGEPWLCEWLPLVPVGDPPRALDVGCGVGRNARLLIDRGFEVTAIDFAASALDACAEIAPEAKRECVDFREGLPFPPGSFELVVADLSLHYFDWSTTAGLLEAIAGLLVPGGLLAARFNSIGDANYGADEGTPVGADPRYLAVRGIRKRYFSSECMCRLFGAPWTVTHLEEKTTDRFGALKVLWEVVASKP